MPKIDISGSADIDNIKMQEQGSTPSTPAAGFSAIYVKSDGLYVIDDAGNVTGPLVSSAGGTVAARFTSNNGQSIDNDTITIVNYEDQVYDTNTAVTIGAAWKFTAPSTGYYHVEAKVLFTTTTAWGSGEIATLYLYKEGAQYSALDRPTSQSTGVDRYLSMQGSDDVQLNAGQTVDIRAYQATGSALALHTDGAFNFVSIHKI